MEQIYMIEIFIDKVTIFTSDEDDISAADKNLIIKVNFGPKAMFIINEGQLAKEDRPDDIVECDDEGKKKFTRSIRIGKSYMFPSYPDTVLMTLSQFPLEIEVWNDDENEIDIFVGVAKMAWDKRFYQILKEANDPKKVQEPLAIKQTARMMGECGCKQVGNISFILRIGVMGDGIVTEFQHLMSDPESFVFRTNRNPAMFHCKRIEGDDPNFVMVGTLYETTTLEDPEIIENAYQKIEICTELQSCGSVNADSTDYTCEHPIKKKSKKKVYPIDKIRMGDIIGPCGNANCALAHKIKNYVRALESYKKETGGATSDNKDSSNRKICGTCSCKDERYHRDTCPEKPEKTPCHGCGGMSTSGDTCDDKKSIKSDGKITPKQSSTNVAYVFNVTKVPNFKESEHGRQYLAHNLDARLSNHYLQGSNTSEAGYCTRTRSQHSLCNILWNTVNATEPENKVSTRNFGTNINLVYNTIIEQKRQVYNVHTTQYNEPPKDNDCSCNPPKKTPPCRTFDCDCLSEIVNISARRHHKSYCPLYKHKPNCPVTMSLEEQNLENIEEVEDKVEPLPYGLPPIHLGPCPILGRPCTVPDGFARMYKNANQPPLPPSHSEAGKVCCSKEYWRVKNAIKEYLKTHEEDDFKCLNRFNVDTERRCCDKEQALFELMGKACCGAHKLSIQDKFKENK